MTKKKPPPPTSADAIDDDLVPYYSGAMAERLSLHALTEAFVAELFAKTGGPFKEEDGGNWERVRHGNWFLRPHESRAPKAERDRLASKIKRLESHKRPLVDSHAKVAGISLHHNSPALTTGEVAYLSRVVDWVEISDIEDLVECITTAFPGTEVLPVSEAASGSASTPLQADGTAGEESAVSSPAEPSGKRTKALADGVNLPDDYLDTAISLEGKVAEIKARINQVLHATLIAEVQGKNRLGLTDWIEKSKLKGFKLPEEYREEEAA